MRGRSTGHRSGKNMQTHWVAFLKSTMGPMAVAQPSNTSAFSPLLGDQREAK